MVAIGAKMNVTVYLGDYAAGKYMLHNHARRIIET